MKSIKTFSQILLLSLFLQGCGGGEAAWVVGLTALVAIGAGSSGIDVTDNQLTVRTHLPAIGDNNNCIISYNSNTLTIPECIPDD